MATATSFDRLLKLGQQKGGLTTDDLVRALPIEAMTVEEFASLITRLEGANVPVEVDQLLFFRPCIERRSG
jgi:Sigma-70 factor, region 1.1